MPVIQFKRGSLQNFNALKTRNETTPAYENGTFYFVEDTNRLYLAKTNSDLVDLNQWIHSVATTNDLPSTAQDGDFYYITGANVFAVYNSANSPAWTQVNPDTSLAVTGDGVLGDKSAFSIVGRANSAGADITQNIRDTSGKTFTSSMGLVAGNNIQITADGNNITITATDQSTNTTYDLGVATNANKGQIQLSGNDSTTDTVEFVSDCRDLSIVSGQVNGVPTITFDGVHNVASMAQSFDANGNITTVLRDSDSTQLASASILPTFRYGNTPTDAKFNASGIVTLPVYSKSEVDQLITDRLAGADALTYKGTVDSTNIATTIGKASTTSGKYDANMGDTYKLSEDITFNNVDYRAGDLFIAGNTANGDVDGAVTWSVVPSGDDQELTFTNNVTSNPGILVHDGVSDNNIGGISFATDSRSGNGYSRIGYSASTDAQNGQLVVEMRHGAAGAGTAVTASATATQVYVTNPTISTPVVTGISLDEHGHVSSATITNLSLTDTHATMNTVAGSVSALGSSNNRVYYQGAMGLDGSTSTRLELSFISDNLTITPLADANNTVNTTDNANAKMPTVKMNLEWGTF